MSSYPSESSLVMNATQEQLSHSRLSSSVVVSPSQRAESDTGYDITFDTATRLELQYKAVYGEIVDREFEPGSIDDAVKFPFDGEQAQTLLARQVAPGTAFYVLPVVGQHAGLDSVLESTVFVDVWGLQELSKPPGKFDEYTFWWVPIKEPYEPKFSGVYLKDKTKPEYNRPKAYEKISNKYIYSWSDVGTLSREAVLGVPVRLPGNRGVTTGYERVRQFERNLLESRLSDSCLEMRDNGVRREIVANKIGDLAESARQVGARVINSRPTFDGLPGGPANILGTHQYLLDDTMDSQKRSNAVRESLIEDEDENGLIQIDYSGLDPRQGSRYRQYSFLMSGSEAGSSLEVPIGF